MLKVIKGLYCLVVGHIFNVYFYDDVEEYTCKRCGMIIRYKHVEGGLLR